MLVRQELVKSQSPDKLGAVLEAERAQPDGTRLELALHLGFKNESVADTLRADVIGPANSLLSQSSVKPWPEQQEVIALDGNILRIRWYKNSFFWPIVWGIVRPLLIALLIVGTIYLLFWVFSRYIARHPIAAVSVLGLIVLLSIPVWLPALKTLRSKSGE